MKTNKTLKTLALGAFFLILLSGRAAAEGDKLSLVESYDRPSTYVEPGTLLGQTCRVQRLYNLCNRPQTFRQPIMSPWSFQNARSGQGFKLFQIASLFIDSIEIASFGDWSVRINVEIR